MLLYTFIQQNEQIKMSNQLYIIHHPKIKNVSNQTYFKISNTEYFKTVKKIDTIENPHFINTENFPNIEISKF